MQKKKKKKKTYKCWSGSTLRQAEVDSESRTSWRVWSGETEPGTETKVSVRRASDRPQQLWSALGCFNASKSAAKQFSLRFKDDARGAAYLR